MKKTKIIIPAMGMLLLGTAASVTGTVAWFSMNTSVKVSGMSVSTKVDSNLLVAASTAGTGQASASAFGTYLDQIVNADLQPSSSINGTNFYYTYSAKADGSKESGDYTQVVENDIAVDTVHYKAYADYILELKAVNTGASSSYILLNKLNLLYNNAAVTDKAYRVAIFVQAQASEGASTYAAISSTANKIYSISDAAYFTSGKAVNSTTSVDSVSNLNGKLSTMTVGAGKTVYYKVTARLWLEGEDTTCNNTTYMSLTHDWKLNLGFTLADDDSSAVQYLGSAAESTYALTQTLTNVKSSVDEATVVASTAFSATYTANTGYNLPETISVTVGEAPLTAGTDYTWTPGTGLLVINSQKVTGAVVITVAGVAA